MKCPTCTNEKLKVWRTVPTGNVVRRERICLGCGNRIWTEEQGIMSLEFRAATVATIDRMREESTATAPEETKMEKIMVYVRELEVANTLLKNRLYGKPITREAWAGARRGLVERH